MNHAAWILLFNSIAYVESGHNPDAVGDGGRSIGVVQIHEVVVADVNRIVGRRAYLSTDRLSQQKSFEIFQLYTQYWAEQYVRRTGDSRFQDPRQRVELIARIWNGGPNGMDKPVTRAYWRKVQAQLAALERRN